jgi:hypothetical protein
LARTAIGRFDADIEVIGPAMSQQCGQGMGFICHAKVTEPT